MAGRYARNRPMRLADVEAGDWDSEPRLIRRVRDRYETCRRLAQEASDRAAELHREADRWRHVLSRLTQQ